jgi:hypothetical protein
MKTGWLYLYTNTVCCYFDTVQAHVIGAFSRTNNDNVLARNRETGFLWVFDVSAFERWKILRKTSQIISKISSFILLIIQEA